MIDRVRKPSPSQRRAAMALTSAKDTGERRYAATLPSGLTLILVPRPGFASKFAMFTARYGAVDASYVTSNGATVQTPAGIAHFLEHQLFKKAGGDLTEQFTANGAYTNAQTGHTSTAYYFECVSRFEENLDLLLGMCLTPYFEKKLVDVERDIIIQEIVSYRDHPFWINYQGLLRALYKAHPVRVEIAGDEASVAKIGPRELLENHQRFYHPANCSLVVAADIDPKALLERVERTVSRLHDGRPWVPVRPARVDEPRAINRPRVEKSMHTALPRFLMGYKDDHVPAGGNALVRHETVVGIVLDMLFGRGTGFYESLYADDVVSGNFGADYHCERDFGYLFIGGETTNPKELERRMEQRLAAAKKSGFDVNELNRKKHKIVGRFLRNFEACESSAFAHQQAWLSNAEVFDIPEQVETITLRDLEACFRRLFTAERRAVCVVDKPHR